MAPTIKISGPNRAVFSAPTVPVHCEYAMVLYLASHASQPLSFIGISKLSCHTCYTFLCAYNKMNPRKLYQVSGTHGKVYLPSVFGRFTAGKLHELDVKIRVCILTLLEKDLKAAWNQLSTGQCLSDSTAESGPSSEEN